MNTNELIMNVDQPLHEQQQILIITGYSGAGKNTVLHALEDIGFYCVDNLPVTMLDSLFRLTAQTQTPGQRVALGLDVRSMRSVDFFMQQVGCIRAAWPNIVKIIFLTCGQEVLIKRFQETRRKHPLANNIDLSAAIAQEQGILQPLIDIADMLLDTDQWNIHELRQFIRSAFAHDTECHIIVNVISFGFKYGVPPESNFVYDVRSLPNPYFVPELKLLNGTDQKIIDYLFAQEAVAEYWNRFHDFTMYCIKKSYQEGRVFMNLAIGCTGGRHRSVAFAHRLVQEQVPYARFTIKHRDIDRDLMK